MGFSIKNKQILIASDFDINNNKLINVKNPTNNQDVSTKIYVDSGVTSLSTSISAETSNRNSYDASLSTLVSIETSVRTSSDTSLSTAIIKPWSDIGRGGFVDNNQTSLIFNSSTYVFTLSGLTTWEYYRSGIRYSITGDRTITLPSPTSTTVMYYITINSGDGTLISGTTQWTLLDATLPVATVLMNSGSTPTCLVSDERHSVLIDRRMHAYLHFTRGTQFVSGGELTGPTLSTATDAACTYGISETVISDEDLFETIPEILRYSGTTLDYTIFYRTSLTTWSWKLSEVPFSYTPGSFINYDNNGTLSTGAGARWYNSYVIFVDNENKTGSTVIMGRSSFTSLALAQAENPLTFDWTGYPIAESIVAYQLTWNTAPGNNNKGKVRLVASPKKINISTISTVGSGVGTDHNTLAGLQGGTTNEYYHLTNSDYITATGISSTVSIETSTRLSADNSLSSAISTETSTRTSSDTSLSTVISNEISKSTSLSTALSSENSTRTSSDISLSTLVSVETSNRIVGDTSLSTVVSSNTSKITSLSTAVSTETSTRTSVDTSLSTLVSSETSTRSSVDTSLSTLISTETSNRTVNDTSLSTLISTETSNRTLYDSSLSTAISLIEYDSAGIYTYPTVTDNGNGTITISTGECCLFSDTNFSYPLKKYIFSGNTLTLINNSINYVTLSLSGTNAVLSTSTNRDSINQSSVIPLISIYREGTILHELDWDNLAKGLSNKLTDRLVRTERFTLESGGLVLGESSVRYITISSGYVWYGAVRKYIYDCTSSTDKTEFWYHNGGNWTSSTITQYNNTQYDDGSNLQTLSSGKYAVNWIFRSIEDAKLIYVVLGNGNYKLTEAEASTIPIVPTIINTNALLVGRIIVVNGGTSATEINSAFTKSFSLTAIQDHAQLMNLDYASSGHIGFASETGITSISTLLSTETSTRNSSDISLSTLISAETSNRVVGDTSLSTSISIETSNRTVYDTSLSTAVSTRISVDTSLSTAISTETSTRTSADTSLSTLISSETSNRTAYDTSLSTAISGEISKNTSLSTAVSTETSTRSSADTSLSTVVSSNASKITSLSTAVSTETSTRTSADTSLSTAISVETSNRVVGDTSLSTIISSNISNTVTLSSIISVETSNRIFNDNSLSTNISIETSTRISSDTSLSTAVSSEISNRIVVDSSLSVALSNVDDITTNLSTGQLLYYNGTTISGITNTLPSLSTAIISLSTAISSSGGGDGTGTTSLSTALSTEISTRTSADTSLSTLVSSETSTRTSADTSLSTAVSTETSTRTSADTSLSTAVSTRISVDTSLSTAVSTETSNRTAGDTSLSTAVSTRISVDTSLSTAVSTRISVDTSLSTRITNLTLDNLSDVVITTPSDGQTITYSGSTWTNVSPVNVSANTINGQFIYVSGTTVSGKTLLYTDGTNVYSSANLYSGGGTSSSPGISFSGDTDTGFFRQAANTIGVSVGGTEEFRFLSTGAFHADDDIVAYSTTTPSDKRLKENFKKIDSALDKILQLDGVSFNYIKKKDKKFNGYIAQDVESIIPNVVYDTKLPLVSDDDNYYKVIRYQGIIPYITEAIKEQHQIIMELNNEINILKNELNDIKNKIK